MFFNENEERILRVTVSLPCKYVEAGLENPPNPSHIGKSLVFKVGEYPVPNHSDHKEFNFTFDYNNYEYGIVFSQRDKIEFTKKIIYSDESKKDDYVYALTGQIIGSDYSLSQIDLDIYRWGKTNDLFLKINNELKKYEKGQVKINNKLKGIDKIWTKIDGNLREV